MTEFRDDLLDRLRRNLKDDRILPGTERTTAEMIRRAPERTGLLKSTTGVSLDGDTGSLFKLRARSDVFYASFQDQGTGPIFPINGTYLRFALQDGTVVFAKRTSGVPKTDYFLSVLAEFGEFTVP